jgi:PST family polysaccharide transporter
MVVVFTGFVQIFIDYGLTTALVYRIVISEELLSSCFWISLAMGLALTILLCACAPMLARLYNEPVLITITIALASTFFISSLGTIQKALLTRKMNFKTLAVTEIATIAVSGCIAVAMAYKGYGVWSLVWQAIVSNMTMSATLWFLSSWRPRLLFKWSEIKEIMSYSLNQVGYSAVSYWSGNLDNLLIGKYLGSSALGFYNLAYNMLLLPLNNISAVLGRVMFPALSSIQNDKRLVRDYYIKANRYIATLTFPMMAGLFVLAPQFIHLVFGPQWTRSIFLFQILAVLSLPQSIAANIGWIYASQGRTDIQFKWGIFYTLAVTISFIIGLHWNVEGVTMAYTIVWYAIMYPCFAIPFKLIDLKVSYFFNQLKTIFIATVFMAVCTWIARYFLMNVLHLGDLLLSVILVFLGICLYIVALVIIDRELYNDILVAIKLLWTSIQHSLVIE